MENKNKLKWRSLRRSMLEVDLCFEQFIQNGGFDKLTDADLIIYSNLLEIDDSQLLSLFQSKERLDDADLQMLVGKIKENIIK
jgi:antitoxin CptB